MLKRIKQILGIVLIAVFLICFIYILFIRISGGAPGMFGYNLLRVSSASMEPELNVGEIIVVKEVDPATLQLGDVITYRGEERDFAGKLITHQISKEPYEKDGVYYFTTRGIQPNLVDDPEIDETQVLGKVIYKLPLLGTVYDFFSQWYGLVAILAIIILVFSTEIYNIVTTLRYRNEVDDMLPSAGENVPNASEDYSQFKEDELTGLLTDLDDEAE